MDIELAVAVSPAFFLSQYRIYHSVCNRIQAVYLGIKDRKGHILTILNGNFLLIQPFFHIPEIQDRINAVIMARIVCLLLFCNTGA